MGVGVGYVKFGRIVANAVGMMKGAIVRRSFVSCSLIRTIITEI